MLQNSVEVDTYHDSQSAGKLHGYCYYDCNCCIDPLTMSVLVHHALVQPTKQDENKHI